jgi:hypothetical protein
VRGVFLLWFSFIFVPLFLPCWLFHTSTDGRAKAIVARTVRATFFCRWCFK